jgi:hypothetical protein
VGGCVLRKVELSLTRSSLVPRLQALETRGFRALGTDDFVRTVRLLNDRVAIGGRAVLLFFAGSDLVISVDLLEPQNDITRDLEGLQVLKRELLGTLLLQARDLRFPQFDRRLNVLDSAVEAKAMPALQRKKAVLREVLAANLAQGSAGGRLVDWR